LLLLFFSWTGIGNAASTPTKEIQFWNNSAETMYVVLISGARTTDEWMQALTGAMPDQRETAIWTTLKDYRVYVNGKSGIPPRAHFAITVPFFTLLVPFSQAVTGTVKDSLIDWWNGGRMSIYDSLGATAFAKDYDKDVAAGNLITPKDNSVVTCREGACGELKIFGGVGGLPSNDPSQLTEFTFGDAITADKTKPYPFKFVNVGYNISSVDQVYLPVAMGPLGNRFIPYIGSVKSPVEVRNILQVWLKEHPGWPVYKGFPGDHPRIPEAHVIFLDAYNPDGTYNTNSELTAPGQAVNRMVTLAVTCLGPSPPNTTTCNQIRDVMNTLFIPNYQNYTTLACSKGFVNTALEQLRHLYGWAAYNTNCGGGVNPLAATPGVTAKIFATLQDEYRLDPGGVEYNFRTEAVANWFNPYVQLIHGANYLNMAAYAFSIDDAIGFQSYPGAGLIYAVGGTKGLENPTPLDKKNVVNVTYGHPPNTTLWLSAGLCNSNPNDLTLKPEDPSFDFYPPTYPCMVSAKNIDGNVYQLRLRTGPSDGLTVDCFGVTNPAWCSRSTIVPPNHVTGDSTK
jgi:hypothetical protein